MARRPGRGDLCEARLRIFRAARSWSARSASYQKAQARDAPTSRRCWPTARPTARCANWPRWSCPSVEERIEKLEHEIADPAPAEGRGRREERDPRNPRRHRRLGGGAFRRRPVPHVRALRRRRRAGRSRCCRRARARPAATRKSSPLISGTRRLLAAEVRIGRAPRAARSGDRGGRAHPHLGRDRRGAAGGRGHRHRNHGPRTSGSTRCARRAPAASTSTRPTRPCASPTCRPASW